jgi:hypothetical protein
MTDQHPITPPPELVQQWATSSPLNFDDENWGYELFIAHHAAQWGADQELEACEMYLAQSPYPSWAKDIRAARRPKPPTLNSIALQMLGTIERDAHYLPEITDTIRKALEQLDG